MILNESMAELSQLFHKEQGVWAAQTTKQGKDQVHYNFCEEACKVITKNLPTEVRDQLFRKLLEAPVEKNTPSLIRKIGGNRHKTEQQDISMTELSSIMPMKSFETEDTVQSQKGSITTRDLIIYQNTDPCLKQCPTNDFRFEGTIG